MYFQLNITRINETQYTRTANKTLLGSDLDTGPIQEHKRL